MQDQLLAAPSRPPSGELLGAGRVQGRKDVPQLPKASRRRRGYAGRYQAVEREAGGAGGEKEADERRSSPAPDHGILNGFSIRACCFYTVYRVREDCRTANTGE